METSLHVNRAISTFLDFVQFPIINSIPHSGTVWNTNDDTYSDFGHFLKMWKRLYIETFPHFLFLPIFENVKMSLYRNISTFLDFVYFLKVWKHFLILSSFQYFIIVSIPHSAVGQCETLTMKDTLILVIFWPNFGDGALPYRRWNLLIPVNYTLTWADNSLGTKFWCQQKHLVTSVIC